MRSSFAADAAYARGCCFTIGAIAPPCRGSRIDYFRARLFTLGYMCYCALFAPHLPLEVCACTESTMKGAPSNLVHHSLLVFPSRPHNLLSDRPSRRGTTSIVCYFLRGPYGKSCLQFSQIRAGLHVYMCPFVSDN